MSKKLKPINVDLKNRTVILKSNFFKEGFDADEELFLCKAGFGCNPVLMGKAIYGQFLSDGEEAKISRDDVEFVLEE